MIENEDDDILFIEDDDEEEESSVEETSSDHTQRSYSDGNLHISIDKNKPWKALIVDDDEEIHFITKLALKDFAFDGKKLEFVSAFSGEEAKRLIQDHPDTALILMDVVMEEDEAGLKAVKYIRDELENYLVRIILRTGQPGQAPENQVIIEYDINDYKTKTELTAQKLVSTIVTALRSFRDIISRIEAQGELGEKTLQLQEERNIFISGPVCIFKWANKEGIPIEYASPNVQEVLGYTMEEMCHEDFHFIDLIHPDDQNGIKDEYTRVLESRISTTETEYRITRKDGKILWLNQFTKVVRNDDGDITHFYGYCVDITKKKETEQVFFENAAEGIVVFDRNRNIDRCNKAMCEILGCKDESELKGKPLFSFMDEENKQVAQHMCFLLDQSGKGQRFEIYFKRNDGSLVPCMFNPSLIRDLSGNVIGSFAFVIDLTERKQMEDDLRRAMKAEKRFIATMSHEIRTPLTSILGFVELLRDTALIESQKELVQNISISSQHLLSLINSILDVSKVEAGQLELTQEEMNVDEVLSECGIIVSNRIGADVKLLLDIPEFDYYVYGDQLRMKQIFVNLLGNASKFTESGHIKLYLDKVQENDEGFIDIVVCVEDTGAGIPAEKQPQMFKPFKQAHSSKYGGTGLGLYLSKSFANLMNGDITFESEEGKGTTFFVSMRLKKGGNKESKFKMDNRTILYIEDEDFMIARMQEKFESIGAKVIISSGDEGTMEIINKVKDVKLDAAVIDIDFKKDKSGNIIGLLKELFPNLVLIGVKSEANVIEFPEFHSYLSNPFTFYQLSAELNELFSRSDMAKDSDFSKLSVMVVEDVQINQALAIRLFKKFFNLDIDTASDGIEAVEKVEQNRYDVVFMDMNMPNMNGTDATRKIRTFNTELPIVALTANAYAEDIEKAYASGMNGYVTKPFEKEKIKKALLNVLNGESESHESSPIQPETPAEEIKQTPVESPAPAENTPSPEPTAPAPADEESGIKELAMKALVEEFGEEDAAALMEELAEQTKRLLDDTEEHIRSNSQQEMTRGFHSIKGMLLSIHLNEQAEMAKELEMMGRDNKPVEEIIPKKDALFSQLRSLAE